MGAGRLPSMGCILIGPAWSEGVCFMGMAI
jgi:hypothetical protein